MKTNFILLIILSIITFNCKDKKENECNPLNVTADIQFNKVSESCKDIDLLWEITFGVSFEFLVDIKCEGGCSDKRVSYRQVRAYIKKQHEIIELSGPPLAGGSCNQIITPSQTLNTRKVDDPGLINYEVGDTIVYEFLEPVLCTAPEMGGGCFSEETPLDVQEYTFEYVLQPEDFDCE